ncbi:MAG TPA: response regulator transcription factor [Methylomirabilota bacterium]|nr:response regulator transcription factor [Methylomirabilota bacterium]
MRRRESLAPPSPEPAVYVVDDDASVRRALGRLLRSVGLHVETYESALAFVEQAPADRPACLVLDVRMPALSGLDLQHLLARHGREIPIVFITGHGDVPTSVRAMREGAEDFLLKPVHDRELIEAVRRALERDRQARRERADRDALARRYQTLTPREREVLDLVVRGLLNKQVGAELGASEKTIKVHRARVMEKMAAASLPDLVRMAERLGAGQGQAISAS